MKSRNANKLLPALILVFSCWWGVASAEEAPSLADILQFNPISLPAHEGAPKGVPTSYDWARNGVIHAGNTVPKDFSAIIGWGQVFTLDNVQATTTRVQIRNFKTFLCHGDNRQWVVLPGGRLTGAQFNSDYVNNISTRTPYFSENAGIYTVGFDAGHAYHFYPTDRLDLPDRNICGVIVMLEARIEPGAEGLAREYLIGLGADYWLNKSAPWDQYKTNAGLGVGQLKLITDTWKLYGFSTASGADVQNFMNSGLLP